MGERGDDSDGVNKMEAVLIDILDGTFYKKRTGIVSFHVRGGSLNVTSTKRWR